MLIDCNSSDEKYVTISCTQNPILQIAGSLIRAQIQAGGLHECFVIFISLTM
ncbi:hypothetical protein X975_19570, partial [Stegodyphus mimosarum]